MRLAWNSRVALKAALALAAVVALTLLLRTAVHRVNPERIREQVIATIQREARESFLVTGSLDITATATISNTRTLLPGLLNLNLGTSSATVQVPGRAYYGFDVRKLTRDRIRIRGDTLEIDVPQPQLLSVDANLQQLQVRTDKGWLRTPASVDKVEHTAIRSIDAALARQAASYVANSAQPHINSAHALEKMILPVVQAGGLRKPVFRFRIGEHLVLE